MEILQSRGEFESRPYDDERKSLPMRKCPGDPQTAAPAPDCGVCAAGAILELHCKLRCLNCGYTRDCSDPYLRGW